MSKPPTTTPCGLLKDFPATAPTSNVCDLFNSIKAYNQSMDFKALCENQECLRRANQLTTNGSSFCVLDKNGVGIMAQTCLPTTALVSVESKANEGNSTTIVIAVVCCVGVIVMVCGYMYMKRKKAGKSLTSANHTLDLQCTQSSPKHNHYSIVSPQRATCPTFSDELNLMDLAEFRLPYKDVKKIQPLARGSFGEVWLGEYNHQKVAVKKLMSATSAQDVQYFIWEIFLLSKIYCPYVVQFIGVTWKNTPSKIMLITEFMDGGDLRSALEDNSTSQRLSWITKVEIALHVAEGLVYLHSLDPKVIHRDLKSRNVMLDSSNKAKITDFGVARESIDGTMTSGIGTYRWMAPEVLTSGHYSESADIFSFGVILSELSSETIPYSDLTVDNRSLTDAAIITKVMAGEILPSFAANCPIWFSTLGTQCMALEPENRPTATSVAFQLRNGLRDDAVELQETGFV